MFRRYFTFKDEPLTTVAACALLTLPPLSVALLPGFLIEFLPLFWLRFIVLIIIAVAGALLLCRLRATETLRQILIISIMIGLLALLAACLVALTAHTIAEGLIVSVPRKASFNYIYIFVLTVPAIISSAVRFQKLLREIDG